jgi:SH3-like domain-containing protein
MFRRVICLLYLFVALVGAVRAGEFRSIQDNACILYDAPSTQATKRFIVGVGYPFEVLVKLDRWTKVRDDHGDVSWVEAKSLSEKRMLIVTMARAEVRDKPAAEGVVVFRSDKGLLLELTETETPADGWVKIRHRDGQSGYISNKQVWGL